MNATIEEKRAEAVRRMKRMGIYAETIRQFEQQRLVSVSEPPMGAFYWVDEETAEHIRYFEESHDALVYMVIRSYHGDMGTMDSFLYVSDWPEEWEYDNNDIQDGFVVAFVYNRDCPELSEIGSIGIRGTPAGGLVRDF